MGRSGNKNKAIAAATGVSATRTARTAGAAPQRGSNVTPKKVKIGGIGTQARKGKPSHSKPGFSMIGKPGFSNKPVETANKFHEEDLKHFPQVLAFAGKIRDQGLAKGTPAMTGHAVEARIGDHLKTMSQSEVINSLRTGRVVEINDGPENDDCRLLVRDDNGVCVIYSTKGHRIITCWWNDPSDSHKTLDMSNYQRVRPNDPSATAAANRLKVTLARGNQRTTR